MSYSIVSLMRSRSGLEASLDLPWLGSGQHAGLSLVEPRDCLQVENEQSWPTGSMQCGLSTGRSSQQDYSAGRVLGP
jgi:hypothetical protein